MTTPHHVILDSLLGKEQYEACRSTVEDMIKLQMEAAQPDDHELAHLHLFLCRALQGEHRHDQAGAKADIAEFLARKLKDWNLVREALYRAGFNYIQAGNYPTAVERFTASLDYGDDQFKAKALFNRGHAHERQLAFSFAAQDMEQAIQLVGDKEPSLLRDCRMNLAWHLILLGEFERAEKELNRLSAHGPEDRYTQLQMAHDRLHILHLKGEGREALLNAVTALRQAGTDYPDVKALVGLTLMSVSVEEGLVEQGFALGVLSKRLAGKANRLDLDQAASRKMQALEFSAGADCLAQSLLRSGQVAQGALSARRTQKRVNIGGVN